MRASFGTDFAGTAEFREAIFEGYAGFSTAAFNADASFSGVAFEQLSWFADATFEAGAGSLGQPYGRCRFLQCVFREDPAGLRS